MATPAAADPRARWRYPYEPQPKQDLAHRTWAKERLYGGAAGGAKTDWLIAEVVSTVLRHGVDGLILRRTYPHLSQPGGIIQRLLERIPPSVGTYNKSEHVWTFRNGAHLQLGYLASDADAQRYVGGEYGVIAWDQLEQFTEWQYRRLFHPLRLAEDHPAAVAGFVPHMIATANPGGTGHHWVKRRWIDPAPPFVVWQPSPSADEPEPGTRVFIPARLEDNRFLGPAYEAQLMTLPSDERRALRWGDWDVYVGARFGQLWHRDVHVIDPEDFPVPSGAGIPRGRGVDYGLESPWCTLWGALFPDGLVVIYRELYEAGFTPAEQAGAIRTVDEATGERAPGRPLPTWLDPSCWARSPDQPRRAPAAAAGAAPGSAPRGSIADTYRRSGVAVLKANNDRRAGTALIADKLRVRADGAPRLLVYSTCLNLIRTLPGVPRDKHDPELYVMSQDAEQHAVDALRYLLMGLDPTPPARREDTPRAAPAGPRAETAGLRTRGF